MSPTRKTAATSTAPTSEGSNGFSAAERSAMRSRAAEMRAAKQGAKAEEERQAVLDAIAKMPDGDRELCARLHEVITSTAPDLAPRTWYGMPAYAKDGKVLLSVKHSGKFGQRYTSLEFQDVAAFDDGDLWPIGFAIPALTPTVEEEVAVIVRRAVG